VSEINVSAETSIKSMGIKTEIQNNLVQVVFFLSFIDLIHFIYSHLDSKYP